MLINQAFAKIMEFSELKHFQHILEQANQDTLVIFDVDHVLIMPTNEYTLSRPIYRTQLWQELKDKLPEEKFEYLFSIVVFKAKWQLVDDNILQTLSHLNSNKIPTIALTALNTGKLGIINNREDLRIKELSSLGINFKSMSPFSKDKIIIHELENKHGIPMLKNGIILTAELDKGQVLEYILNNQNYRPKSIIFVDDKLINIQSIESICERYNIKCCGIHYTAVAKRPPILGDYQKEKERIRLLEREHRWQP
jgi:histidinol phosphatase-like enzyme